MQSLDLGTTSEEESFRFLAGNMDTALEGLGGLTLMGLSSGSFPFAASLPLGVTSACRGAFDDFESSLCEGQLDAVVAAQAARLICTYVGARRASVMHNYLDLLHRAFTELMHGLPLSRRRSLSLLVNGELRWAHPSLLAFA